MTGPVGGPHLGEDELVEKVTAALYPELGDRLTATRAVRVVLDEQARLRATTPGDDRGRELAELRAWIGGRWRPGEYGRVVEQVVDEIDRRLAAPAETEAGEPCELIEGDVSTLVFRPQAWAVGDRVEHYDAAMHAWREGTVTKWEPHGPGGPVLSLRLDSGTELWTKMLRSVRSNLIAERNYWRAAATPPAHGEAKTEGGWLCPASGPPEWVRYAEATQARYAVRSDLGVTHPTDTVRLFEVFNALAARGYRLVESATPPAHPTPADALAAPTAPDLTRERVIAAVDLVNRDLTDPRPFGEYVADRLGLTEDTGGEERR